MGDASNFGKEEDHMHTQKKHIFNSIQQILTDLRYLLGTMLVAEWESEVTR